MTSHLTFRPAPMFSSGGAAAAPSVPADPAFLEKLRWTRAHLLFEATAPLDLWAFSGSAFRGALGELFRPALCELRPACASGCRIPERCRYHQLFERDRSTTGQSIPKPLILDPPLPMELEEIVHGGPVAEPFLAHAGWPLPSLSCESVLHVPPGAQLPLTVTVAGSVAAILPGVISLLGRGEFPIAGGRIRLCRALDEDGATVWDAARRPVSVPPLPSRSFAPESAPAGVRRARVLFLSPALVRSGEAACFDPATIASVLFERMVVRAAKLYNEYCASSADRLPRLDVPPLRARLAACRLFRYELPRWSNRQQAKMRFDGVAGWMDIEGNLDPLVPFAQAAEVLHLGQKATFGMGRIRFLPLE
jgi:hypothetical protein